MESVPLDPVESAGCSLPTDVPPLANAVPGPAPLPEELPPGRYRHYKGRDYVVLGIARHSETEEELVVYRLDYGDFSLWVRPKAMFQELVSVDGRPQPRFQYIGPD